MQSETYRAVQVSSPGKLELVERPVTKPSHGAVRIRVEACGICHTDAVTVNRLVPTIQYPRVPGHEVVGTIDAIGDGVIGWAVGQKVAVGYLGGPCFRCEPCRRGDYVNCKNQPVTGVTQDGGYAEVMMASQYALSAVPKSLSMTEAAPLVCAGLTSFNALRNSRARAGDLVGIQGVGGLGHLAIQYARAMGFRVAAIARGTDKAGLARQLGAHHYIDSHAGDAAAALQELGGARVILATVASGKAMSPLIGGLAPRGSLVAVGVGGDSIDVPGPPLVLGSRVIKGSLTGSAIDGEDTMAFSALSGIRAMIETVPLERAADAYKRMMENKARFRMVLVMN